MPIGKVESFDMGSQNWDTYIRRVKQFMELNDIEQRLHVATLVTLVGSECYDLMCDLCAPDLPEEKDFDILVKLVKDHLEPERSEIAERHIFRQRKQQNNESIRSYLQSLKHLAKTCNFGITLEINLRDQFVSGLYSEEMRSRLFAEKDIDYKRAVELASALEAADRHAMAAGGTGGSSQAASESDGMHRVGGARAEARCACRRCGKLGHAEGRCRYKHYTCDSCGEKGHLKSMCRNRKGNQKIEKNRGQYYLRHIDQILISNNSRKSRYSLSKLNTDFETKSVNDSVGEVRESPCMTGEKELNSSYDTGPESPQPVTPSHSPAPNVLQPSRQRRKAALTCIQRIKDQNY